MNLAMGLAIGIAMNNLPLGVALGSSWEMQNRLREDEEERRRKRRQDKQEQEDYENNHTY